MSNLLITKNWGDEIKIYVEVLPFGPNEAKFQRTDYLFKT